MWQCMYLNVCMYVCMYVCMLKSKYVTCMYVMYVCMYMYGNVCVQYNGQWHGNGNDVAMFNVILCKMAIISKCMYVCMYVMYVWQCTIICI
jgi:hypothetical protein